MLARITTDGRVALAAEEDEGHDAVAEAEAGGHGEEEPNNPILPATAELIYAILSFVILVALMYKFAFPSVKKAMDARSDRIRESLDDAERTKAEASRILEEYQRQLADAKSESGRIIEEARQTAEQLRRDLMARAEAEVAELRARSTDEIQAAQQRAIADLRGQVKQLAIQAAELVVQKNLDRETNDALVEQYINQVGTRS